MKLSHSVILIPLILDAIAHGQTQDKPSPNSTAQDKWANVEVVEAFPGSLAHIDEDSATVIGASSNGSSMKGNVSINSSGTMAITWLQSFNSNDTAHNAAVIVARSKDGVTWEKKRFLSNRNDVLFGGVAMISIVGGGIGPQAQIDEAGNVLLVTPTAEGLRTYLWKATSGVTSVTNLQRESVAELSSCGFVHRHTPTITWFELYRFRNNFYLITYAEKTTIVYYYAGDRWDKMGGPISSSSVNLGFDDVNGTLYLIALTSNTQYGQGRYPAVYKYDDKSRDWKELVNPQSSGLHEAYGVTSYMGVEEERPAIVAHDGLVWVFWFQPFASGPIIQGAVYRDRQWQSCSRARVNNIHGIPADKFANDTVFDSFGQGHGMYVPNTKGWLTAVRDDKEGSIIVLCDGYNREEGITIKNGTAMPLSFHREGVAQRESWPDPKPALAVRPRSPLLPHSTNIVGNRGYIYVMTSLRPRNGTADALDVCVYKLVPSDMSYRK